MLGDDPAGGNQTSNKEEVKIPPKVELPVYHLNNYRKKAKAIVFFAQRTITEGSLKNITKPAEKRLLDEVFTKFLDETSNVGIVDLDADEVKLDAEDPDLKAKLEEASKADTIKMSENFADTADRIRRVFGGKGPAAKQDNGNGNLFGDN